MIAYQIPYKIEITLYKQKASCREQKYIFSKEGQYCELLVFYYNFIAINLYERDEQFTLKSFHIILIIW